MKQRVISAAVMIVLAVGCMLISPFTRILLFTAAAVLSIMELKNVFHLMDIKCVDWALYMYIGGHAVLCAVSLYFAISPVTYIAWAFFAVFCGMLSGIVSEAVRGKGAMATMGILVYPLFSYAAITLISINDGWIAVFILACLATWICDSFALFGGKAFGKHKVAPYVSPHKTVEGCICGALSSLLAGVISFFIIRALEAPVDMWICLVVSLIASTFGQVGDLAASLLKRMVGLKDYSNLIPGHGGMMDRADSLLFSIPAAWYCLYILQAI